MRIANPDTLAARANQLRAELTHLELGALAVTSPPNIAYLTGFFASASVLVATSDAYTIVTDGRYAEALDACAASWPRIRPIVLAAGSSYDRALVEMLGPLRGLRVGFEGAHVSVNRHRALAAALADRGWSNDLVPTDGVVERQRVCKDEWEAGRLREGGSRLSIVAKRILSKTLEGRTEAEVAGSIDAALRGAGFERPSFDTIVAAGPGSALPHAQAGGRRIARGDLVVVDFGGVLDGYCTDLTRTVAVGGGDRRQRAVLEATIEAQAAAFAAVAPGVAPAMVDAAARDHLAAHGLAERFTHGTGHGLGLEVHEAPRLTRPRADQPQPALAVGMAFTLEPGVYIPGWGGVRIEDDVLITEEGAEWLTDVPRTL
jgi:Xaa-Pro aminopeptidase